MPACVQASLGESVVEDTKRSVLSVTSNGQKYIIASLLPGKSEHAVMELMFEAGQVEFTVSGKNSVHIAGNLINEEDEDDEDDEDENEDEDTMAMTMGKKLMMRKAMGGGGDEDQDDEDEDDDEEGDDDEDGEEEGDEDDEEDNEEGNDDDEDDDEEEDAPPAKKRPAGKADAKSAPPAKQQKNAAGKPAPAETPKKGGEAKSAPPTPGSAKTPVEVPADVKGKMRQILSGQAQGVKGADIPRDWEKKHGTKLKDVIHKLGFKKQGEFLAAMPDVCEAKGTGSDVTFFATKGGKK